MIVDTLDHIEEYRTLSPDIFAGLEFIRSVHQGIPVGKYPINENVIALVTEYPTVEMFERGYEAHRHVIDIQYPVRGLERILWSPVEGMKVNIPYDKVKDRTFFRDPSMQGTFIDIGKGIFAIMFPGDAHSPQHFVDHSELIKKITIKVTIL